MKRHISFSVLVLVLTAEPMALCQAEAVASGELQPGNIRIDHGVLTENQPILRIFLGVLRGTGLNGGFAEIAGCSDEPEGSLRLRPGITVREAMDALVAANPNYQWDFKDGVVELMPRVDVPLLHVKIGKFQVDSTERETPAILEGLLRLPEVRARAAQLDLKPGLGQGGPGVYDEHPVHREPARIHANWQNLSLLEALNGIVRASRKAVWIYRETDCSGDKTYSIEAASDY
jgi:hypothetical protein